MRTRIGAVLGLVMADLAIAVALAVLDAMGAQLPRGMASLLSAAGAALIVLRVLLMAPLALSVVWARENS